jgi:hypothetical protein
VTLRRQHHTWATDTMAAMSGVPRNYWGGAGSSRLVSEMSASWCKVVSIKMCTVVNSERRTDSSVRSGLCNSMAYLNLNLITGCSSVGWMTTSVGRTNECGSQLADTDRLCRIVDGLVAESESGP